MEQIATAAFYLGMIAYSAAATLFFVELARKEGRAFPALWAVRTFATGVGLHAAHVVSASFLTNICPISSLPFALSFTAVLMGVVYLALRRRLAVGALGVAVAPMALCFLIGAQVMSAPASLHERGALLGVHIAANIVGFGFFLLAGAASAFYLVQERRLKRNKSSFALGGRLPALDALDTTEHRLLLAGFPLLTLGVLTGAVFLFNQSELSFSRIIVVVLAYGTWLQVAAMLVLRSVWGWRGRRTAYGTLAGVAAVAIVVGIYFLHGTGGPAL